MSFSQQEEDVLAALGNYMLAGVELARYLNWPTSRLYPILAQLEEKGAIKSETDTEYPKTTYYSRA